MAIRVIFPLCFVFLGGLAFAGPDQPLFEDRFDQGRIEGWTVCGAPAALPTVDGSLVLQTTGDSQIFLGAPDDATRRYQDVTIEGDVSVEKESVNTGFVVRAEKQVGGTEGKGYFACLRDLGVGYAAVQLYRFPGWTLLQESRVRGEVKPGRMVHLKLACRGPNLWVWANDMNVPALTEFDETYPDAGFVALKADNNKACFDNIVVRQTTETPRLPLVRDWSWVKGAVFIASHGVNSYQMWEEWDPAAIERELCYARFYGLNTVQVYLNFLLWQKQPQVALERFEQFLALAAKQELKVLPIFFDDVGNVDPPHLAPYAPPVPGLHNSQMMGSPGREVIDKRYPEFRSQLQRYVQDFVKAHREDPRIPCWQTCNEPSHASTLPLIMEAYGWIKETGSKIPVTATGGGAFFGGYASDFPTFHSYLDPKADPAQKMVLGDGGSEHLCTETLDRPAVDLPKLVRYFSERRTGWVAWELMVGRDNCRYPWGSPPGAPEPAVPFHGIVYPDGHPWSLDDVRAIRGNDPTSLPVFSVHYFADESFGKEVKASVVPRLDFDLNAEPGTAASDASAGVPDTRWSNRYTGRIKPSQDGRYAFMADTDGTLRILIGGQPVVGKAGKNHRASASGEVELRSGAPHDLVVEYSHDSGPASLHVYWSGPGLNKQLIAPAPPETGKD